MISEVVHGDETITLFRWGTESRYQSMGEHNVETNLGETSQKQSPVILVYRPRPRGIGVPIECILDAPGNELFPRLCSIFLQRFLRHENLPFRRFEYD